jgi:hypothetical protein
MDDAERVAQYCKAAGLRLETAHLMGEYGYNCLPLCVIDAVWSIGVRYGGVENVVARYCTHHGLHDDIARQRHYVRDLVSDMRDRGFCWYAERVFQNAQRTSTRNGILKAEAVFRFAAALDKYGMDTMRDVPRITWYEDLREERRKSYAAEILSIPGQRSGISLSYFFMLTGSPGLVKPDRMVGGFLHDAIERWVSDEDAQRIISYASRLLNVEFPNLTPRALDHEIWLHQSGRSSTG